MMERATTRKHVFGYRNSWVFVSLIFLAISAKAAESVRPQTTLHCGNSSMRLSIHLAHASTPELHHGSTQDIHLLNSTCKATQRNNTHALLIAPLAACNTRHKVVGNRVIFYNWFVVKERARSRDQHYGIPVYRMPFHCVYDINSLLNIQVYRPVRLVPTRSSPSQVSRLLGFPVTLRCSFIHGVPPITMVMKKSGKTLLAKTKGNGNNSLSYSMVLKSRNDFGKYMCVARDGDQNEARHAIEIKPYDVTPYTSNGIKVFCTPTTFQVKLRRRDLPWLDPNMFHLHLLDASCLPRYINSTHIIMQSPVNSCKTQTEESYEEIIYRNMFIAHARWRPGRLLVSQVPDVNVPIRCRHARKPVFRITVRAEEKNMLALKHEASSAPHHVPNGSDPERSVLCPLIYANQGYFSARSGQTISLTCHVDRFANFLSWTRCSRNDRVVAAGQGRVQAQGNVLAIRNVTDMDGGVFSCNTDRKTLQIYLYVEAQVNTPMKQYIQLGRDGVISCYVSGFPPVSVTWKRNGRLINRNGRYHVKDDGRLRILRARQEDSGNYTCEGHQQFTQPAENMVVKSDTTFVYVYKPLLMDMTETSRKTMRTFQGVLTNIVCSYLGGAPPVLIRLVRAGQTRSPGNAVTRVDEGTLYATLDMSKRGSFGGYKCIGEDTRGDVLSYEMVVRKIGGRGDITQRGVTLRCGKDYMDVTFNRFDYPWLDIRNYNIHLNSSRCTPYKITTKHIDIRAPLNGCGTIIRRNGHMVTYYNMLVANVRYTNWSDEVITRNPDVLFPFKCTYWRRLVVNNSVLKPAGPLLINSRRSSPRVLYSQKGMTLTLTCAFEGGVQPLYITMGRNGIPVKWAKKTGERTLAVVVRAVKKYLGEYQCTAHDEAGQRSTYTISLKLVH